MSCNLNPDIVVFHLVRASNPITKLKCFLDSYNRFSAGYSHRLVFLFKGFKGALPDDIGALLSDIRYESLYCPDYGYDIGTYSFAARRVSADLFFFTNSNTEINCHKWLRIFVDCYIAHQAGAIGATGSWQSKSSHYFNSGRSRLERTLRGGAKYIYHRFFWLIRLALYPKFPNPHLRTNSFLISRVDFLKVCPILTLTKLQAFLFESGYRSMTRKLERLNKKVLVVGRNHLVYAYDQWDKSNIFWQGDQTNITIHDNRTRDYELDTQDGQASKSWGAWKCMDADR